MYLVARELADSARLVNDEKKIIKVNDFKENILKLSYGKKKHFLIKII